MAEPGDGGASTRTEEVLRQSEERFRLLVEGVKDYAIFMLDPEGRVTTWNAGAERIKGYRAEEIIGEHFSRFYTEDDVARGYPEKGLRVAAAEGRYEDEGPRVRKDGSTFWANVVITALRDADGNLRGFGKVTRDVTARKEAEERERLLAREQAARERAADILESISDAFFAVDKEWRFTYVNRKAEEIWVRSREDLLGKNLWEKFPEAIDSESYRQIRRAMDERVTTQFETLSPVLDTWIAGRVYPSREGLSVYFQDVTERMRAEEEIRRSEQRYKSFVEQSTEGIWRFELEEPLPVDLPVGEQIEHFYRHAFLAECNDAVAGMYGYERAEEIVGARLGDFLPRSVPQNVAYLKAFIRSGYRLTDAESEERDREGERKRFLNNLTGVVEDGFVLRAWGTQRDVTEQRRTEAVQRFLAEASATLSSSLDYRTTLSTVTRSAVPTLADWCAVDIVAADGSPERLAVEHPDPEKVALAYELQERYPSDPDARTGVPNVLRTGRSELYTEVTDEMLESVARDDEHLGILREIGFTSVMIVPMIARGRTLGAITLVSAESGRRYAGPDLELTEELARRAALAMDNAMLYEEAQKEIAERERAQEELRGSRDQLEIILRGVADGITAQDSEGRLIYANEAATRMVGYPFCRGVHAGPHQRGDAKIRGLRRGGTPARAGALAGAEGPAGRGRGAGLALPRPGDG